MPYVEECRRKGIQPMSVGDLTFAIQQLLKKFIDQHEDSYAVYSWCLGALRGAELDLWDRKIQPYEVLKRDQNGDVW